MKTTRAVLPYQNRPGRRSSRRKLSLSWAWQWIRPREGGSVAHTSPWSLACRSWSWGPGRPCPHTTSLIKRRCWINTFTKDSPKGPFRLSGKILMQLYPSRKHSQCLHAAECWSFGLVSRLLSYLARREWRESLVWGWVVCRLGQECQRSNLQTPRHMCRTTSNSGLRSSPNTKRNLSCVIIRIHVKHSLRQWYGS